MGQKVYPEYINKKHEIELQVTKLKHLINLSHQICQKTNEAK